MYICKGLGVKNECAYINGRKTKIFLTLPGPYELNTNRCLLKNLHLVSFVIT